MTMVEIRKAILNALREACKASIVDQSMQLELNAIEEGENPRDILGIRWCDLIAQRWDKRPRAELIKFFDAMA